MSSSSSGLCIIGIDPGSRLTGCALIRQEQTHRATTQTSVGNGAASKSYVLFIYI